MPAGGLQHISPVANTAGQEALIDESIERLQDHVARYADLLGENASRRQLNAGRYASTLNSTAQVVGDLLILWKSRAVFQLKSDQRSSDCCLRHQENPTVSISSIVLSPQIGGEYKLIGTDLKIKMALLAVCCFA
jgi:hypothetical protein